MEDVQQQLEDAKVLEEQLKGIAMELEDVGKQAKIRQMKQTVLKFLSSEVGVKPDKETVNAPLVEVWRIRKNVVFVFLFVCFNFFVL